MRERKEKKRRGLMKREREGGGGEIGKCGPHTIPSTNASCEVLLVGLITFTVISPNTVRLPPRDGEKVISGGLVAFS